MVQDLTNFLTWLRAKQPRLAVSDPDLLEVFWQAHPRLRFFKALPWGANVLDLGAGSGGLAHWRGWLKPERADLTLYGVDRNPGEFRELYAAWDAIDLDREMPNFAGVNFDGFIATHLIEYLRAPEELIRWMGERATPDAQLYIEWTGPGSRDLPTREQLSQNGIDVVTSNFTDDREHEQAPGLALVEKWLGEAGFGIIASGAVDLGILGEELFARAADRDSRSMGYWSLTRSSLYTVAIKSAAAAAVAPRRSTGADASASAEDDLAEYLRRSAAVPGWTRGKEAEALARASFALPPDPVIVEIGAFMGSGTILLAGARKLRGSGRVHVVDPFDGSGDAFSVPVYAELMEAAGAGSLRKHFENNIRQAGLAEWVEIHQGRAADIAGHWTKPVDMIFFDGDQSRAGVREAYNAWAPFLKPGGIIALHNSSPDNHRETHDGHRCLAEEEIVAPGYSDRRRVNSTTFARRAVDTRLLRAERALLVSGLFDAEFYRATYADMRVAAIEPLAHYLTQGEAEGRSPNAVFMPRYYRRRWMAGRPAEDNALLHYIEEGERCGAKPHPAFDPRAYLAANPPLAEFVDRPLFHYLTIGRNSGLPVAPGPGGEALARVLAAQPHALRSELAGGRGDAALQRYKELLANELGPEKGPALYDEVFNLEDAAAKFSWPPDRDP
jgi:predicted O-methyltransferase YrrM